MKKATLIAYNPFVNSVKIQIASDINDPEWKELAENSELRQYTNPEMKVLFSNIATEVVRVINEKQNSSEDGLEILFYGPKSDYEILAKLVENTDKNRGNKGKLSCRLMGFYKTADDSIQTVKNAFSRIAKEFEDYLPGQKKYKENGKEIGDHISAFKEIIRNEIPICVIGNYSVGKSAFINSLIGDEVLPSDINPSTAKNVKIICNSEDKYCITVNFKAEATEQDSSFEYEINKGNIRLICVQGPDEKYAEDLLSEIEKEICLIAGTQNCTSMNRVQLLHGFLDVLNNTESMGLISNVGWNVVITVPFVKSLLSKADSSIVIYDTPGSNNAKINQAEHRKALESLMEQQTNALPILMTEKDNADSNDMLSIKNLLDKYSDNFSAPNCLVLISKCDQLYSNSLQKVVSPELMTWHGRSTILNISPVAAIGIKKPRKDDWVDQDYKEIFEGWTKKYKAKPSVYTLPEYNVVPCEGRDIIDAKKEANAELYATGIPSVEAEILYYIKNYANYKKAFRGKETLDTALNEIEKVLAEQQKNLSEAKIIAGQNKQEKKAQLLERLNSIHVDDVTREAEAIGEMFADKLESYISTLPQVLSDLADQVLSLKTLDLDGALNEKFKDHCQMNLIDQCYYGKDGIQQEIIRRVNEYAKNYMKTLGEFVSNNASTLSDESKADIQNYLTSNIQPPVLREVNSILESFSELLEKRAMIIYRFDSLVKDEDAAKERWLESKRKAYERRLRDGKTILNKVSYGQFNKNAIYKPLEDYAEQLKEWAINYRGEIAKRLDSDNAILSGMEEEIKQIINSIDDISNRLDNLDDVKNRLDAMTKQTLVE